MELTATVVFLSSVAVILYVLVGYPLLLEILARLRPQPFKKEFHPLSVSVLLPVYNGERFLRAKLDSILNLNYPPELLQIIVISDGSTDATEEIAASYASRGVILLRAPRGGKARALNAGIAAATGEILFLTDVRQPLDPNALRELVSCFADPSVGAVSGELKILEGDSSQARNIGLYWRYEKWIRTRLSLIDSVLGATGAIYAIRRSLVKPMPPGTLLDDVFLPLGAFFQGYRVVLDRSAVAYDYPTNLKTEFWRKVRTLAGNYQAMASYPSLLSPSNRMWFCFLSHKVGRLVLPFALLAALVSSFFLPSPWNLVVLAVEGGFYFAALLDVLVPETNFLKRLTSPPRAFVVMMAAALCGLSYFVFGTEKVWKETRVGAPPQTGRAY